MIQNLGEVLKSPTPFITKLESPSIEPLSLSAKDEILIMRFIRY